MRFGVALIGVVVLLVVIGTNAPDEPAERAELPKPVVAAPNPVLPAITPSKPHKFHTPPKVNDASGDVVLVKLPAPDKPLVAPSDSSALVAPDKAKVLTDPATIPKPEFLFVTGSRVNVRAGPGTTFAVLGQLRKGEKALVLGAPDNGWQSVKFAGKDAWMSAKYLSAAAPNSLILAPDPPKRGIAAPSSREITAARKAIIQQSLASYPGNCPCPCNRDRAGRRCGKRSAYSKPGGYSPICYESDVTQARLDTYFARQRGASN